MAKGEISKPSEVLIKVWRAGQNMRKFFEYGDVKFATEAEAADVDLDMPPPPTLERGPSIYSGADVEVVRRTSEAVITRALFLLRVNSSSKAAAVTREIAKKKWALLSKTVVNRSKSADQGAASGEKWHALVGEVQAAYQLKGMLSHRRREAALRKELTTSEKILRFVQGNVKVEDLESIRSLRNERAKVRAAGLSMMANLVGCAVSPFTLQWLMCCFARAIGSTKRPESVNSHVHYLNCIEGCSSTERELVIKSFCSMVEKCVSLMAKAYGNSLIDNIKVAEKKDWEGVTISCIRALAIDYDAHDHGILDSSNILTELQFFLRSESSDVQRTGWALFELLLPRCIGQDQQRSGPIASEPSEFSKKIVALLVSQLDRAASKVTDQDVQDPNALDTLLNGTNIIPGTVALRRDSLGYTMPHIPMGLYHTFSFWVRRKKCPSDDAMTAHDISEGHRVMRGPNWLKANVEDGGKGGFGTVTKVENDRVSVKWDGGNTGRYKYGTVEEGKVVYELSIVDESVGGHLFSKGMTALTMDDESAAVWSTFGLSLAPSAKLEMFAYSGGGEFVTSIANSILPADEWTHVAVVQEKEKSRIYLNGALDVENTLPSFMLYPGAGGKDEIIVESLHPYADNTDQYTEIHEPGAISYTITFDPQTSTENNYDFLRFYIDDR